MNGDKSWQDSMGLQKVVKGQKFITAGEPSTIGEGNRERMRHDNAYTGAE